ncbi:MAG: hypothetical protein AAB898_02100 [Patescibacteria group bacterium]
MKKYSMFLFAAACAVAALTNLCSASADESEAWDGQNLHVNWDAETPVVTLLSSKTAVLQTGTQVQVMGSADAGWTMHLTTEESPEVEQINISSPTVVTGVLRVKGAPSTAEEAVILFPYFPFQEARAVYTARMTYWWCKETGEGCDAYQAWKATSPHVVSVTVVEPEVEAAIESAPAAVVATTTDRAEVVVPDWQRRPVVETEVDLDEEERTPAPVAESLPAAEPSPGPPREDEESDALAHAEEELRRLALELAVATGRVRDLQEQIAAKDRRIAELEEATPPAAVAVEVTSALTGAPVEAEGEDTTPPPSAMAEGTSPASGEEAAPAAVVVAIESADDWGAAHLARMRDLLREAEVGDEPY